MAPDDDAGIDEEQLVLGDLLNHVLDKGVVIAGTVTISVADIDLLMVDLFACCSRRSKPRFAAASTPR